MPSPFRDWHGSSLPKAVGVVRPRLTEADQLCRNVQGPIHDENIVLPAAVSAVECVSEPAKRRNAERPQHEQHKRRPAGPLPRPFLRFVAHAVILVLRLRAASLTPTENRPRNPDDHGGDEGPRRKGAQTRKEPWFDVAFILIVVAHAVIPGD